MSLSSKIGQFLEDFQTNKVASYRPSQALVVSCGYGDGSGS